jgi:membrane-bound serine protease (ClpP class)
MRAAKFRFLLLGTLSTVGLFISGFNQTNLKVPSPVEKPASKCTVELKIEGVIGPGILDYMETGLERAEARSCGSILMLVNTPGGNLQTTRMIVEKILNAPVPFLCLVAPSGGHAGSAGAIILQACHVSGALKATNIGAATPIMGTGQKLEEDLRNKIVNDTVSWVEGLAKRRNRSLKFAKDIITEAKAVEAEEALKLKAIDFVGDTVEEFLAFAKRQEVEMTEGKSAPVEVGEIDRIETGLRHKILDIIADPQFAYLLFMGSLALLYFELTHPGTIVPGVVGALGLVLSMISFHKLNIWWGGLVLMLLGMVFMIAEAFVPSFGALGIGGVVAFILGSVFLFDAETSGYTLPLSTILPTAIGVGLFMLGIAYLAFNAIKRDKSIGEAEIVGVVGEVVTLRDGDSRKGQVELLGEIWKFECESELRLGQRAKVESLDGLTVKVKPLKEE